MEIDDFAAMMVRLGEQQPVPLTPASRTWRDRHAQDIGKKAAWRERYGQPAILARMSRWSCPERWRLPPGPVVSRLRIPSS